LNIKIKPLILRSAYRMIIELLGICFAAIFFYYSFELTKRAQDVTNVFAIPKKVLYSCLPVSGLIMVIYSIRNIAVEVIGLMKSKQEGEKHPV
jgi:TRAP-type C4-dicarboxylate transport system permease small subunit